MTENIVVVGNIATDPQLTLTGTNISRLAFRIAAPHRRFDTQTGSWVDGDPNFFAISAFRALAEHAHASLRKGDRVIVTGRLRVRDWSEGERRGTSVDIEADAIGPDLRWGTTQFTSATRQAEPADSAAVNDEASVPHAEEVSVPF